MYHKPAVRQPSMAELCSLAEKMDLGMTEEELQGCTELLAGFMKSYQRVSEMPEPLLPVKYPRTPGHRPVSEENPYNAWYWKTDIHGASEGKLSGKTVGIKDNVAVAGVPMMNGSKLMEGYVPEFDATVVTRVLDAGGHITGKTVCENFCLSGNSFTSDTGPVRNPHNEKHSTGGSSSGSAALVAGGKIDMAIGGDQGGSIRMPSCWCGVVGIKPTFGLVPYTGAMSILGCLDHLGPIARTVFDCALLLEVIAGYDNGLDPRQQPDLNVPNYTERLEQNVSGLKIGLVSEGFENCKNNVDSIVRDAALSLKEHGMTVEECSIPLHNDAGAIFTPICFEGGYEVQIRGHGSGFGWKGHYCTSMQEYVSRAYKTRMSDASLPIKFNCLLGTYMREKYDNYFYAKASNQVRLVTEAYNEALKNFDVLVMPTVKFTAPELPAADVSTKDLILQSFDMIANTAPFDLTGHPALSINTGMSSSGLPVGMMIIGRHFDEVTVLKVAQRYEKHREGQSLIK